MFPGLAAAGGIPMSAIYRAAEPADAAAIAAMFADSFVDTFGHLYPPDDLAEFLSGVTADAFAKEIADEQFAFRLALDGDRLPLTRRQDARGRRPGKDEDGHR